MIHTLEKRKGRGGPEETKGEGCDFTAVVHAGLTGKGRFERRLEGGGKKRALWTSWTTAFLPAKAGRCLGCSRKAKWPMWVEQSEEERDMSQRGHDKV